MMLKQLLPYMILLFSPLTWSQTKLSDSIFDILKPEYIEEFAQIINQVQLDHEAAYAVSTAQVSNECTIFINKDSFIGPLGLQISKTFVDHPDYFSNLLKGGSINRYCRNFSLMTIKQKSLIWVLLLTVIAHFESSCNIKARAQGPNGIAYGYYQLHKGQEQAYDGPIGMCVRNASRDPRLSTQCALGMLEYQFQKAHGELFSNNSYWDVLRPNGRAQKADDIRRALTKFSLCNPRRM